MSEDQRLELNKDPKYQEMQNEYGNILRAKGFCWLADEDSLIIGFAQSGRIVSFQAVMPWYTVLKEEQWGVVEGSKDYKVIRSKFQEPFGDRRQELVFIGIDLKIDNIQKALDACLLTGKDLEQYKKKNEDENKAQKM